MHRVKLVPTCGTSGKVMNKLTFQSHIFLDGTHSDPSQEKITHCTIMGSIFSLYTLPGLTSFDHQFTTDIHKWCEVTMTNISDASIFCQLFIQFVRMLYLGTM